MGRPDWIGPSGLIDFGFHSEFATGAKCVAHAGWRLTAGLWFPTYFAKGAKWTGTRTQGLDTGRGTAGTPTVIAARFEIARTSDLEAVEIPRSPRTKMLFAQV